MLSDEKELGTIVETTVYKHIVSFYQGSPAQLGYFKTFVPILRIPAIAFLYLLGKAEADGQNGRL